MLLNLVLLIMVIISYRTLLNKVNSLEEKKRDDIKGDFFGFVVFYTLLLVMFFAFITKDPNNEKIKSEENPKIENTR